MTVFVVRPICCDDKLLRLIPVILFFVKIRRIGETIETPPEVPNVLETSINTD